MPAPDQPELPAIAVPMVYVGSSPLPKTVGARLCLVPGCDHDPDSNCVNPGLWGNQGTMPEGYRKMAIQQDDTPDEVLSVLGSTLPVNSAVSELTHEFVEATAYVDGGEVVKVDVLTTPGIDASQVKVTFGGVENRKALTMVTEEELAAELLKRVYPDWAPDSDHSRDTPRRFVRSLKELCDAEPEVFNFTTFPSDSDEMVTMGPIPFYTLCAHHVVPFHGQAWIGYVPKEVLCGLSKLARAVRYCAKGMHVQENLTAHIHNYVDMHLQSRGLAVVLQAEHMCMSMRGVKIAGAITTTAKMSGVFADHERTAKAEFMHWTGIRK